MCTPRLTIGWDIMNKNLREKMMRWFNRRDNKIDYSNWTQKKEETRRESVYFFRNTIH
jgi:hypothetical protein